MLDTRTSPASAEAAIRAAMCTARPPRSAALDLSRVHPSPDLHPDRRHIADHGEGAPDGGHRPIEGREEPVPRRRHLPPAEPLELGAHQSVMLIEHVAPRAIPHLRGHRRRVDDVGEQQGREHAIGIGAGARPGQELLDLVEQRVDALREREMVGSRQLDEPRPLDRRGRLAGMLDRDSQFPVRLITSVGVRIDGGAPLISASIVCQ